MLGRVECDIVKYGYGRVRYMYWYGSKSVRFGNKFRERGVIWIKVSIIIIIIIRAQKIGPEAFMTKCLFHSDLFTAIFQIFSGLLSFCIHHSLFAIVLGYEPSCTMVDPLAFTHLSSELAAEVRIRSPKSIRSMVRCEEARTLLYTKSR